MKNCDRPPPKLSKNAGATCTKWPYVSARSNLATLIESSDGQPQPIGSGHRTLIKRSDNIAEGKPLEIGHVTTQADSGVVENLMKMW